MSALRAAAVVAGAAVVVVVLASAVRTVVVPRAQQVRLARAVFVAVRRVFELRARPTRTYEERDRVMALFAPVALLVLPAVWVVAVGAGFTLVQWGLGVDGLRDALVVSGSSLTTLGSAPPPDLWTAMASYVEAVLGLGLIALVISYLPSIYAAFQRRELAVAMLETRAGEPPSALELIERHHALGRMDALEDLWEQWELWFADLQETHTSQASLPFFRSPAPGRSWITAAGAVLDAASLMTSVVDAPRSARAQLCIRSGYLALRDIAGFFQVAHQVDPRPDDPIAVERFEFDEAYERLARRGVPLVADRDQAWRDFAGWRVNYDQALLGLASLVMAPNAPWSSDRSPPFRRPPVTRRARRRAAIPAP